MPSSLPAGTAAYASTHYLPALDGLRAASILLVVASHLISPLVPGGLGVTLFFFISGYIITTLLLREHDASGTLDIKAFYIRRFLRLTPALYVFIALSLAAMWLLGQMPSLGDVLSTAFYYANYWEIFHGYTTDGGNSPFSITWSLAIEEHFYLLFPLTLLFLLRHRSRLIPTLIALLAAVLAWRFWLALGGDAQAMHPYRIYKGTDTRLDSILYGVLFAILFKNRSRFQQLAGSPVSLLLGLLLLLATLAYRADWFRETLRYSVQGIAIAMIFAPIVLKAGLLNRLFALPPMVYLGKISYSLYLYHWLVACTLPALMHGLPNSLQILLMLLVSLLLAHLSYRYVERIGRLSKTRWVRA